MAIARSWDPSWERIFSSHEWGKYPPEELVRFIARKYYSAPKRKSVRILDIGCGTGAATWFLAREGFDAHGVDGSPSGIQVARRRFASEGLEGDFKVGDFVRLDYPDDYFDCVVDIVAMQHNRPVALRRVVNEVLRVLKPGGRLFSMMISATTRFQRDLNPLADKGYVHYFKKPEIRSLFSDFTELSLETSDRTDQGNRICHFVIMAQKAR